IRDRNVTGVQTCALPISSYSTIVRSRTTFDAPNPGREPDCLEWLLVFNLFGRSSKNQTKPPRAPGNTIRARDLEYLSTWSAQHGGRAGGVEGFVEPETIINEMSVVLVDGTGDWTRRKIG